ncbi:MAG: NUDIX domain-containing protein [Succiniclasticum sp.]|jgi:isopentenyldiphosphate isomerase|nr:NUDIX domain-containing protein [Succiniclasticum sp.]MEE3479348.1 NUDIX domain-containing protein [Succiniclasticum sp.]
MSRRNDEKKELLDEVDLEGRPTGRTVSRGTAHREGIRHRTAHVWIFRTAGGRDEILLQKRSAAKDSFPNCYDISSAGHIPAGLDFKESALKELHEELGVAARPQDLHFCGRRHFLYNGEFYGEPFHDDQVTAIFFLVDDRPAEAFRIQRSELSEVRWFGLDECLHLVHTNPTQQADGVSAAPAAGAGFLHCIIPEEVDLAAQCYLRYKNGTADDGTESPAEAGPQS